MAGAQAESGSLPSIYFEVFEWTEARALPPKYKLSGSKLPAFLPIRQIPRFPFSRQALPLLSLPPRTPRLQASFNSRHPHPSQQEESMRFPHLPPSYFPHSTSTLGNFVKCLLSHFHMLPPQLQCGIRRVKKKKKQVLLIAVPPCKLGFHVPSTWGARGTSAERASGAGGGQASKPGRHRPSARAPSSTRHAASLLKKRSIKLIRLLCHSTNLLPHSLLCFKRSCTRAVRF